MTKVIQIKSTVWIKQRRLAGIVKKECFVRGVVALADGVDCAVEDVWGHGFVSVEFRVATVGEFYCCSANFDVWRAYLHDDTLSEKNGYGGLRMKSIR